MRHAVDKKTTTRAPSYYTHEITSIQSRRANLFLTGVELE